MRKPRTRDVVARMVVTAKNGELRSAQVSPARLGRANARAILRKRDGRAAQ